MSQIAIKIKELSKFYGATIGIEGLNLEIKQGEIFGFLGPNGSGKTTTIRCLMSVLLPTKGEIFIGDEKVTRQGAKLRNTIGYVPGELSLPDYFTVHGFLDYIESMRNRKSSLREKLTELFEIPLNKKIGELSKGNKQKVGIISALMHDPDILILDEPTSGLDPLLQTIVYEMLLDLKKRGKTIFFSSHNLLEVQKICDRVGIVKEGHLVNIEDIESLNKSIPRLLKVFLKKPDLTKLQQLSSKIYQKTDTGDIVEFLVIPTEPINAYLDILVPMEPIDLSFPPASLEEYFMQFYSRKSR